jgi:hypothetical protein
MTRSRVLLLLLLVGAVGLPVRASDFVTFEQITVANTAIGITSTITNPTGQPQQNRCVARLETAQIRYRTDGVAPTSTVGTVLEVGDVLTIESNADARRIRFIRTGATSGVLDVECFQ